jgi:hypothetical protein
MIEESLNESFKEILSSMLDSLSSSSLIYVFTALRCKQVDSFSCTKTMLGNKRQVQKLFYFSLWHNISAQLHIVPQAAKDGNAALARDISLAFLFFLGFFLFTAWKIKYNTV